jgi:hypothetical protein
VLAARPTGPVLAPVETMVGIAGGIAAEQIPAATTDRNRERE